MSEPHDSTSAPALHERLKRVGDDAIRGAMDSTRAEAGTELHRLIETHPRAQVTAATSLAAALHASGEALTTVAHLISHPEAPAHDAAIGGLARQALQGVYTVFYVLAPIDQELRMQRAKNLAHAEHYSHMQFLKKARKYRGAEMRHARKLAEDLVATMDESENLYAIKGKPKEAAGAIIDAASTDYAETLQIMLAEELVGGKDVRDKLVDNVPAVASWSWQTLSGVSHCFGWPWEHLALGEVQGPLPQVALAAEFSANLVVGAAQNRPDEYQEQLLASREAPI